MAATSRETTGTVHKKTQDPYQQRVNPDVRQPMATTNRPLYSTNEFMRACTWQGTEQVTIEERPKPLITDQTDAIVRMESVTLCGSDLHLYTNSLDPAGAMMKGDILGHEGVGVVEAVGSAVKNVKPGDKVVISFGIACGSCEYCQREEYTSCDRTNPSSQIEQLYGHRMGAAFGYSHLTGGYDGLQAEFARVPFADVNLLVVPKDTPLQNDQLIMLSDIACTGWHGAECAKVTEGDDVGIWGAGPVGLMAAMWCKYRGAKRVVIIDNEQYRLDRARARLGVEILNFDDLPGNKSLTDTIMEMFPRGLDACIDCVGFRFPSTFLHKVERVLRLETDALDVIDQMSIVTRKWGRIALLGDYFGYGNHFPIGRIMEKSINILGGQALAQKYWKNLYDIIAKGDVDPAHVVVSHVLPFNQIVKAYDMFNKHQDEALKIILEMTPSSMIGTHSSVGTQSSFGTTSRSTTTTKAM